MPDINFETFSTRSFEQLAQALCAKFISSGASIFGDGADGAREATFRGKMSYPSSGRKWNGYLVMQAKFLQNATQKKQDTDWLIGQLKSELEKFCDPDAGLESPQYYLLVTNVRLSSFARSNSAITRSRMSGHDRIGEVFADYSDRLKLKGWEVWHYDKLRSLVDNAPEIRQTYRAWLSTSDVIEALLNHLGTAPNFGDTVLRALGRDLRNQRLTKLQQAGHAGDQDTELNHVFIDLPHDDQEGDGGDEREDDESGIVKYVIEMADTKLDPETIHRVFSSSGKKLSNRLVILGGPGQGKSTISQLIAQIFRMRLLRNRPVTSLPEGAWRVIENLRTAMEREELPISGVARFPIRIELPRFADDIRAGAAESLLDYIRHSIGVSATDDVSRSDLRRWLAEHPWIIVLDGLDEVPATANRADVLQHIDDFWSEVAALNGDVLLVITSRPQGYNQDLDRTDYRHISLKQLSPRTALRYGQLLANVKIIDEAERERTIDQLVAASSKASSDRLLISPLQVAIMIALIESRGEAPTDKWLLFEGYYRVIMNRERSKNDMTAKVIKERSRDIDIIHQLSGLLLQIESEATGASDSFIPKHHFEKLVRAHLSSSGGSSRLEEWVAAITKASTERLVFLNSKIEDRVAFDVRSLQEYTAAAKIMNGLPDQIQSRLRVIAGSSHWEHVFQIAAAKTFSIPEAEYYRDTVISICEDLNIHSPSGEHLVFSGSRIALSLLVDGLAHDQVAYLRRLTSNALQLLNLGKREVRSGLISVCANEEVGDLVRSELLVYLRNARPVAREAAWLLALRLAERGVGWAEDIAVRAFKDSDEVLARVAAAELSLAPQSLLDVIDEIVLSSDPYAVLESISNNSYDEEEFFQRFPFLRAVDSLISQHNERRVSVAKSEVIFSFCLVGRKNLLADQERTPSHSSWRLWGDLLRFQENPSLNSAADLLSSYQGMSTEDRKVLSFSLPWPILCLVGGRSGLPADESLPQRLRSGDFGQVEEWMDWQNLVKSEVQPGAVLSWKKNEFFLDFSNMHGLPVENIAWLTHVMDVSEHNIASNLLEVIGSETSQQVKYHAAQLLAFILSGHYPVSGKITGKQAFNIFVTHEASFYTESLRSIDVSHLESDEIYLVLKNAYARQIIPSMRRSNKLLGEVVLAGSTGRNGPLFWPFLFEVGQEYIDRFLVERNDLLLVPDELFHIKEIRAAVIALNFINGHDVAPGDLTRLIGRGRIGLLAIRAIFQATATRPLLVERLVRHIEHHPIEDEHSIYEVVDGIGAFLARRKAALSTREIGVSLNFESFLYDLMRKTTS